MPIQPLFIASMDTLKAGMRMSGAAQTDALAIIDNAVERVRIGFFDFLGATRIAQIVAMPYNQNGTTDNDILRAKANRCEALWVRLYCLRELPSMFMDAQGGTRQIWNEEGLTREAHQSDLDKEIDRIQADIDALLGSLSSGDAIAESQVNATCFGPDRPIDGVGESINPRRFGTIFGKRGW